MPPRTCYAPYCGRTFGNSAALTRHVSACGYMRQALRTTLREVREGTLALKASKEKKQERRLEHDQVNEASRFQEPMRVSAG